MFEQWKTPHVRYDSLCSQVARRRHYSWAKTKCNGYTAVKFNTYNESLGRFSVQPVIAEVNSPARKSVEWLP